MCVVSWGPCDCRSVFVMYAFVLTGPVQALMGREEELTYSLLGGSVPKVRVLGYLSCCLVFNRHSASLVAIPSADKWWKVCP